MTRVAAPAGTGIIRFLKQEWFLGVSLATIAIFHFDGKALFDQLPTRWD
jgi:hypothetical protein